MNKLTKLALINIIGEKDAELLALRAKVSELTTAIEAMEQSGGRAEFQRKFDDAKLIVARSNSARPMKEHEYATWQDAVSNCKRLSAEAALKHWTFSVVGTKVICRQRMRLAA